MDFRQVAYSRRAVRAFTDRSIDRSTLQGLIEAAIQAPSAMNEQPWSFTVVQDRTLLAQISQQTKAHVLSMPPAGLASAHLREIAARQDFDVLHGAPVLIVIASRRGPWACEDCALAAENLMLAACDEGLGSCWIGLAQRWLDTTEGRAALDLSPDYEPRAPIIIGYPLEPVPPVPRRQPEIRWLGHF